MEGSPWHWIQIKPTKVSLEGGILPISPLWSRLVGGAIVIAALPSITAIISPVL
jgi:hypothetical protein